MATRSAMAAPIFVGMAIASMAPVANAASSQEEPSISSPITAGNRIRLVAPAAVTGRIEGTVIQLDGKSLLVGGNGRRPISVPREAITQLEVSTGRRRQTLKGLWLGAGIGALWMGAACGLYADCDDGASPILGGAASGALLGAGIGALIKRDRWSTVPLDRVRIAIVPTPRRGVRLFLAVGF